jgi:3-oxoacyl-[acyl-carrier-protein] synthase II
MSGPSPAEGVALTGLGAVSAYGIGCGALLAGLRAGRSGIGPALDLVAAGFPGAVLAVVPDDPGDPAGPGAPAGLSGPGSESESAAERLVRLAVAAVREALADADGAGAGAGAPPERVALVVGTSLGSPAAPYHRFAEQVAEALGIAGCRLTVSTACCSSTNALGLGLDLLDAGVADRVVAGGVDVVVREVYAGFRALGVMAPQPCAPFGEPFGMTLGEGAGFVVLERAAAARRRGARARGWLLGYGLSGDGFHETSPDPSGRGAARGALAALAHAGVAPAEVDYVNAHGTGTAANDPAEALALQLVLGGRSVPVSSTKAHLGHAQGAAGVLETIATLLLLTDGCIPPTLHLGRPRPGAPADPVPGPAPRRAQVRRFLKLNAAFGGANASLVLASGADPPPRPAPAPRGPLVVLGGGAATAHGSDLADVVGAVLAERPADGRVPDLPLAALVRELDPRGLDPSTRFLVAAAARALAAARLRPRGEQRERVGIVAATTALSPASRAAFTDSIAQHGLARASAAAFARMVLNAPAGVCSAALGLRGPLSTVTTGPDGGLAALVYAAYLLRTRPAVEALVAGAFDELCAGEPAPPGAGEGAACLVLGAPGGIGAPGGPADGPRVVLAGAALAGPGQEALAARRALEEAGLAAEDVDLVAGGAGGAGGADGAAPGAGGRQAWRLDPSPACGRLLAARPLLGCVVAAELLRRGAARVALALTGAGRSAAAAVVLRREEGA